MIAFLSALVVAMEVHAAGDCPSATEVQRQLAPLLGDAAGVPESDIATVARQDDGQISLTLVDGAGRPIGERLFPRARTCRDDAQSVAVALAIWEARLHPEITLRLEGLPTEPATPAPSDTATVRQIALPPVPTHVRTMGVAAAADWQEGALAPAGRVELSRGRAGGRWRARLGLGGVGPHERDFSGGRVSWWRAFVALGADVDLLAGRRVALVAGASAVTGLVSISGAGFAADRTARSVDAGAELRLRVEGRSGRVRPWAGVSALGWARQQTLDLTGSATSSELPRVEPQAAVGAEFTW